MGHRLYVRIWERPLDDSSDESVEDMLFVELLRVEVNLRREAGESPTCDEYLERFPSRANLVRLAFEPPTPWSDDAEED